MTAAAAGRAPPRRGPAGGRGPPRALCPVRRRHRDRDRRSRRHEHRVRHRRLARPHRRGLHVRERPSLRRRGGPVRGRARRAGQGRRHRLRPAVRVGALRAGRRRGPPGARHPGRHRPGRGPDPDELVRGGPARRGGGRRHHGLAQPVDRQRVQGQVADRRRGGRGHAARDRGGDRGQRGPADRAPAVRGRGGRRARRVVRPVRRLRASSSAGPSTSTRSGRPTSRCSSSRCTAPGSGWIPRLLAGGRIRVTEIHGERNPYFGGVNPEPIRPQRRRGAGPDRRRRLRPRAAARRRRRSGRRRRRAGDVPPPARGHRAAHVLPRRAPGDARPGRRHRSTTPRRRRRSGPHYGIETHEVPVGLQVHRAEDDRDRRDAGRRGVGRVRVRDAPARARRHLRRPVPARPVPARARAGPLAGLPGGRRVPRARRPVVLSPDRRPRRPAAYDGREAARAGRPARVAADLARRQRWSVGPSGCDTGDGFKWFLADGSWLLVRASGTEPLVRVYTEATTPDLRDELVVAGERLVRGG